MNISINPKVPFFTPGVSKKTPVKFTDKNCYANIANNYTSAGSANYRMYNYNVVSFKGNKQFLFNAFKESGSSKIYQFLCDTKTATPAQVQHFLDKILSDGNLSLRFIREITENPRESAKIFLNLAERLGKDEQFYDWYFKTGGYREAFGRYTGLFYSQANNVDELLKSRPNWKLSDIFEIYHKNNGGDPLIGALPKEFGDKHTEFPQFIKFFKSLMPIAGPGKKGEFNVNSKCFGYEVLKNSDEKLVCKIITEHGKTYIIKIDKIYSDFINSRQRANSIYLEAMMGKYLTSHDCKNVAQFHFYDFYHNASVFEYVSGRPLPSELNPIQMNQLTPDLLALGIRTNDTHISNYLQTENGVVNIDLGNAEYFDLLKPGDLAHTIFFPNNTGLNLTASCGGLEFVRRLMVK